MLPDFAASSTSRPDTQETAAYAASQPLFDVLRGAISRLDDQKVHLTGAKDTVQHIHVKIPQEHIENNGTLPADYKDALIAAWKSTTESYVRIFEQLCELTGPDPAAGRQAEASYTGFQKLLYTAEAARTVAFEQDEEITQAKRNAEGSSESESTDSSKATTPNKQAKRKAEGTNESESSASVKTTTPNKKAKQTPTEVASAKRTAEPSPSQAVQRPVKRQRTTEDASTPEEKPTSQASEPATINTVQRLKPKQVRKERKRRNQQRQQEEVPQQATMPPPTVPETQKQQPIPEAQYQDVNAEVDARLRAKEEAKKAKKEAKKRKRDSAASHIIEAEPGAEREATEAKAKALAKKPAKKRSKSENGEAVRADAAKSQPQKGKRGNEEANGQAAAEEEVGGARRSKRTKTKR
jgi:hypothetical protein